MKTKRSKPSHYTTRQVGSKANKLEIELIVANIMKILARTGDVFRELTLKEYIKERNKDDHKYNSVEERWFEEAKEWCKSVDTLELFSKNWNCQLRIKDF